MGGKSKKLIQIGTPELGHGFVAAERKVLVSQSLVHCEPFAILAHNNDKRKKIMLAGDLEAEENAKGG
jgi:hypothetical protein